MKIQEEVKNVIERILKEKESVGGIQNVVWIAAGGSNGRILSGSVFYGQGKPDAALSIVYK